MVVSLRRLFVDEASFVVLLHLPIKEDESEEGDGLGAEDGGDEEDEDGEGDHVVSDGSGGGVCGESMLTWIEPDLLLMVSGGVAVSSEFMEVPPRIWCMGSVSPPESELLSF